MFVEVIDKEKKYARERGLVSKLLTPTIKRPLNLYTDY